MVILMYCVMNGTTILNIFNPEVMWRLPSARSPGCRCVIDSAWSVAVIPHGLFDGQGEGVMMSYTAQSKSANSRAELASVVTGGAITTQPGEGATTAATPAASDVK
jgi:hypothetical protein